MKLRCCKLQFIIFITIVLNINVYSQYNSSSSWGIENKHKVVSKEKYYNKKIQTFSYKIIGEIHYNDVVQNEDDENLKGEFDFYKLVVKSVYNMSKKLSLTNKVIVEHTFNPDYNYGDVYISDLYFKYKLSKKIALQSGIITVPTSGGNVGVYGSVVLSPIEKYLSYSWREAGIGISGKLNDNFRYKATITSGLDPCELDSKKVIYEARNHHFYSSLNNLATGVQLYYENYKNARFGFSALYSELEKSSESNTTYKGAYYAFTEIFGSYKLGNFGTRAIGIYSKINNIDKINSEFYNKVGSDQIGGLLELTYELSELLNNPTQRMIIMLRSEYYDSHYKTKGITDNKKYEHYDYTLGVVYMPVKNLEFKADYQIQRFSDNYSSQIFDLAIGFYFK